MSDIALPANGVPAMPRAERLLGDEPLAKLAGRGNGRAFAMLYERHHQAIYRYCRSIVGNEHDAQDALQSAMMRAYSALQGQQRELAVKPWLFRIAHNESINILRRRRPEQELSEQQWASPDTQLESTVELRQRLDTLVADLQSLPERQRGVLVMHELSGLSMREIARALSISPGAAKQTLFEARSSLHELAEGRAMQCEAVRQAISERDGRVLRGRRIRAHLKACQECQTFRSAIAARQSDLRAIAPPLPAAAAGTILLRLLAHGGKGHAGGALAAGYGAASGSSGASLGGHAVASLAAKGIAGVAVMAAATAGTVHLAVGGRQRPLEPAHPPAALVGQGAGAGVQASHGMAGGALSGKGNLRSEARSPGASAGQPTNLQTQTTSLAGAHSLVPSISPRSHEQGSALHASGSAHTGAGSGPAHSSPASHAGGRSSHAVTHRATAHRQATAHHKASTHRHPRSPHAEAPRGARADPNALPQAGSHGENGAHGQPQKTYSQSTLAPK